MQQEERCINPWVPNLITLVHYLVVMIKRMALTNFQLERHFPAFICQVHELWSVCYEEEPHGNYFLKVIHS